MATVFETRHPRWLTFALFESEGRCVAAVDAGRLRMVLDGEPGTAGALGRIAVDEDWRGEGLFRFLMEQALAWCDGHAHDPVLLYTEDASLYGRFGFRPLVQHSFTGPPPPPARTGSAIRFDRTATDRLRHLLARRTPVSRRCAIQGADDLFLTQVTQADDFELHYAADLDALIVTEAAEDDLVLVDVVAPRIPSMAAILGALRRHPRWVRTMFPPDLLDWDGEPAPDDTGLMARGALPAAMTRPFMLPPTTEF